MSSDTSRQTPSLLAGIALVLANRALICVGLRQRRDGWRRGAGLVLRGEAAHFYLSAFGLNFWSDVRAPPPNIAAAQDHCAMRLARFLAGESEARVCIKRGVEEDLVVKCDGPSYSLGFEPWLDGPARFVRPDNWKGQLRPAEAANGEDVLLNIVCRLAADGIADVWVRVNHIGMDGAAAQELVSRLEMDWGLRGDVVYPTAEQFAAHASPLPCAGRDDLAEMQTFVDLAPLQQWRKRWNSRLPQPMTFAAAMSWCLARHRAFAGLYMSSTVDVAAVDGMGRGVGIVVIRPADYFGRADGLARYARDFNRRVELTRRRASDGCKWLDATALLGPRMATTILRQALESPRAFGELGLTVLKDARVFGTPMGDYGLTRGLMAIGSAALPAGDGRAVGCITIKGPPAVVCNYPRWIAEAIKNCEVEQAPAAGSATSH